MKPDKCSSSDKKSKMPVEAKICWLCKKPGADIRTSPQPPDYKAWWFCRDCYWDLQKILLD